MGLPNSEATERVNSLLPTRWLWAIAFALPLAVLVVSIAQTLFLCDDAFISYRYARNLTNGHGLVFNRGERVEGFTNMLWTLEIAGLWLIGLRPEVSAHVLSLACTAATLAVIAVGARCLLAAGSRLVVTWMAVALVALNSSFAVWSTGGLETRQFTLLVVLGALLLMRRPQAIGAGLLAGLVFAAAELTRPEGLLLFGCAAVWQVIALRTRRARLTPVLAFALPVVVTVATHYLWRFSYYGEWLPNTYFAKHVRPWYESGFDYLSAATIELGAWLWLPLAALATTVRLLRNDVTWLLPALLAVPHALYVAHIGGDHFEYRPLDWHLPLLALPAAEGVLLLARAAVGWLRQPAASPRPVATHGVAVVLGVLLCVYCHAIGHAVRLSTADLQTRDETVALRPQLDRNNAPLLFWLPGAPPLCAVLNHLRQRLPPGVAVPAQEHIVFARQQRDWFSCYEQLPTGVLPDNAVMAYGTVGVLPFYLPDLTVVDTLGLTDAVIARNPCKSSNRQRVMAHDRHPPDGYLEQRGVNVEVMPMVATAADALATANFAVEVAPAAWMPVRAKDRTLLQQTRYRGVRWRQQVNEAVAAENHVVIGERDFVGTRLLSTFEPRGSCLSWELRGAVEIADVARLACGGFGRGMLTVGAQTHEPGWARSQSFVAGPNSHLVLFVGGRRSAGQQLRLLVNGCAVETLLPTRDFGPNLEPVWLDLQPHAGQSLAIDVRDAGEGMLAIDAVMLARADSASVVAPPRDWPVSEPADEGGLAQLIRIEPLPAAAGVACSGTTSLALFNPLAGPLRVTVRLIASPDAATLRPGVWFVGGEQVDAIPANAWGTAELQLAVDGGGRLDLEPYIVELEINYAAPVDSRWQKPLFRIERPLPWRRGR